MRDELKGNYCSTCQQHEFAKHIYIIWMILNVKMSHGICEVNLDFKSVKNF